MVEGLLMGCCGKVKASVGAQVISAGKAAMRVAGAVARARAILVSPEVAEARLAVCRVCPEVVSYDGGFLRCGLCGCGLNGRVRRKAWLATEGCERWIDK
jgi:ribosomal protein L37E